MEERDSEREKRLKDEEKVLRIKRMLNKEEAGKRGEDRKIKDLEKDDSIEEAVN